jgi:hypothetical protein
MIAGVATPLRLSGIELFSALYRRNFRRENILLPELGVDGMAGTDLRRLVETGWPTA